MKQETSECFPNIATYFVAREIFHAIHTCFFGLKLEHHARKGPIINYRRPYAIKNQQNTPQKRWTTLPVKTTSS